MKPAWSQLTDLEANGLELSLIIVLEYRATLQLTKVSGVRFTNVNIFYLSLIVEEKL